MYSCCTSSSAHSYTFLCIVVCRHVVCLFVCYTRARTLLKQFDGFGCHLAGGWGQFTQGKGRFGVELEPQSKHACKLQPNRQYYAATWRIQTRSYVDWLQLFRLLPTYFGLVCVLIFCTLQKISSTTLCFRISWINLCCLSLALCLQ